jgi:hypothetical protein
MTPPPEFHVGNKSFIVQQFSFTNYQRNATASARSK